jgi:hypothetical protein
VGDKIIIGDFEVTNSYNKEKKVTYTNIAVFEYEVAGTVAAQTTPPTNNSEPTVEEDPDSLPFNGGLQFP